MIQTHSKKSGRGFLAVAVTVLLVFAATFAPAPAEDNDHSADKKDAVAAMQTWLGEMDHGDYAKTWTDAASDFQSAVSSDKWVQLSHTVRDPLGAMNNRTLASSLYQTSVPHPNGTTLQGPFVIAQFNTSFANLRYAIETVTFKQGSDGTWKVDGYYIKPGS